MQHLAARRATLSARSATRTHDYAFTGHVRPPNPQHQEELRRLEREIQGIEGGPSPADPNLQVAPGEKLAVYELARSGCFESRTGNLQSRRSSERMGLAG